jgi:hypothetical protein
MPEQPSNIWDKLLRGVQSAVQLRVITVVGEVSLDGEPGRATINLGDPKLPRSDVLATSINLADGDIINVVPEQFWAPDKQPIRAYHEQQVQHGHEIVRRNLQLIGEVGRELINIVAQVKNLEESSDKDKPKPATGG